MGLDHVADQANVKQLLASVKYMPGAPTRGAGPSTGPGAARNAVARSMACRALRTIKLKAWPILLVSRPPRSL